MDSPFAFHPVSRKKSVPCQVVDDFSSSTPSRKDPGGVQIRKGDSQINLNSNQVGDLIGGALGAGKEALHIVQTVVNAAVECEKLQRQTNMAIQLIEKQIEAKEAETRNWLRRQQAFRDMSNLEFQYLLQGIQELPSIESEAVQCKVVDLLKCAFLEQIRARTQHTPPTDEARN